MSESMRRHNMVFKDTILEREATEYELEVSKGQSVSRGTRPPVSRIIRIYGERFPEEKPEPAWKPLGRERIKAIRRSTGLSQTQFCRLFGFNTATVRNWEGGKNEPEVFNNLLLRMIEADAEGVLRILDETKARQAQEV